MSTTVPSGVEHACANAVSGPVGSSQSPLVKDDMDIVKLGNMRLLHPAPRFRRGERELSKSNARLSDLCLDIYFIQALVLDSDLGLAGSYDFHKGSRPMHARWDSQPLHIYVSVGQFQIETQASHESVVRSSIGGTINGSRSLRVEQFTHLALQLTLT